MVTHRKNNIDQPPDGLGFRALKEGLQSIAFFLRAAWQNRCYAMRSVTYRCLRCLVRKVQYKSCQDLHIDIYIYTHKHIIVLILVLILVGIGVFVAKAEIVKALEPGTYVEVDSSCISASMVLQPRAASNSFLFNWRGGCNAKPAGNHGMCTATEGKSADCAGKLGKVLLAAERSTENARGLVSQEKGFSSSDNTFLVDALAVCIPHT